MNIGKAIKELRKQKNLNQLEFAQACDLTQTSVSQIESGIKRPNPGTMKKITEFFGIPEVVIYILATDESDVKEEKRDVFNILFPNVKNMVLDIFNTQK